MAIEFRRVTKDDLELLMKWRMREDISKMMFNTVHLTMEGQLKWYEKLKKSESEIRWIIWKDNVPIGSIYAVDIDRKNERCETGWFLAEKDGVDLKTVIALQQNLKEYIFRELKLNRIYGLVLDDNKYILKLLKMTGSTVEGILKQHVKKDGVFHDVYAIGTTREHWDNLRKTMHFEKFEIE